MKTLILIWIVAGVVVISSLMYMDNAIDARVDTRVTKHN